MALHEQPREDLLREAVALVARAELQLPHEPEPVVVGFRSGGEVSFFFGQNLVLQFNHRHQLRRAFFAGQLLKADTGQLVAMQRKRTLRQSELLSHPLTAEAQTAFMEESTQRLQQLRQALLTQRYQVVGQVPSDGDVVTQVLEWLSEHADTLTLADRPHVR